jgi:hypothetical protein
MSGVVWALLGARSGPCRAPLLASIRQDRQLTIDPRQTRLWCCPHG